MDGRSNKGQDLTKTPEEYLVKTNKSLPRGLLYRELGFKQKQNNVAKEFQQAAEDSLVLKNHEELPCELPDVSRSTFLMVFSPDGTKVASTHGNHNVYVTDLNTGKNVNTLSGHPRTPWCIAFHPSSNQILASGCLGGQVRVWDLHGGSEIWTAESQTVIASLAFHPTDRMLVIATYNELHFWDWSQPIPFTKCYTSNEKEKVRYVAFDPLGHKLITGISNAPHNQSQWDRVATPSRQGSNLASSSHSSVPRSNSMMPPEQERRITVCYRSLVEQYEQLVQRYYDLSRSRTTPTMDRGTDPMDISESSSSNSRSGTTGNQPQSQTANLRSRMNLLHDNGNNNSSTGSGGNSADVSGNADSSPRPDSNDGSAHNIPSVVLMNRFFMRRLGREGVSNSESCNDSRSNDHRQPSSLPRRSSNAGSERHGNFQEPSEQNVDNDGTSTSQMPDMQRPYFTVDYVRRDLEEGGRTTTDSTTRDTNGPPSSHQRFWFSRLHSQAQPSSSSPPERPPRFFISQRSAFQPRVPRGHAEQTHSQPRGNARTASPVVENSRRYFLQQRLAGSYFSPNLRDDAQGEDLTHSESLPHPGLDSTSDMGVRYGIQLLSRHIDNMQRLCRARLEILQLQQIRRMWEDLQRQIRSLHVAVRESTVAMTDTPAPTGNRSRRRIRLYTHPHDDSGLELNSDIPLRRSSRSGESENSSSEQGASHIPSVSQMLELARISDVGPSSESNQTPVTSNNTSEQTNNSRVNSSSQDATRKETLAKLRAQITALAKFKFVVDKTKKEGESSRSNMGEASGNASADGEVNLDSTSDTRLQNSNGEPSISQSANLDLDREPVVCSSSQSTDVPAQSLVSNRAVESACYNILKTESVGDGHSDQTEENDEPSLPSKKKRLEELSSKTSESHSSSDSSFTVQEAIGSSSTTSTIPTILTTTNTTTTTTTISSSGATPQFNRDQDSENNWNRYSVNQSSTTASQPATTQSTPFTNSPPPSNSSNPYHHRLLRISRRVYLRRPRLLALGPRSRRMTGQMSNCSSHRNFSPNIFRHHECGRRPWFMQSAASRNQNSRAPIQSISTAAQVDTRDTADTTENSGITESNDTVSQSINVTATASLSSSDPSPDVSASDQSSSPSEETSQQSVNRSGPSTSSQSDAQTGSSRCQKENTTFVSHDASSHSEQRADAAPHGRKRKTESPAAAMSSGTSRNTDNSQTQSGTQREQTTSESLRAMIVRLESLVRQQREQREAARQERSQEEPTRRYSFRTYMWMDENSGSDSDSNTESDARQSMRLLAAEERVINAIQNHLDSGFASRSRRQRSGPVDDDWEWTRESTRLRARQVLSLMVESLTQFFEENGLSNSTSHAVLDEQIYNLYILLQLALELTDLLLAQLVSTRRELEHQWIHHVRSPVALYEPDPAAPESGLEDRNFQSRRRGGRTPSGNGGGSNVTSRERAWEEGSFQTRRRVRSPTRVGDYYSSADDFFQRRGRTLFRDERESHRFHTRPLVPDRSDFFRLSTYRRLLRYRHSPFYDSVMSHYLQYSNTGSAGRNSANLGVNRGENTRRLGPRAVVNCYSRHSNFGAGGRVGRGNNNRPQIRGAISRRDGTGARLPFARDGGLRIPALRLPGGVHLPTFEEHNSGSTSGRSPHIMVRVQNPTSASSGSTNQSNNSEQHQETPQGQQQQPPPQQQQQQATSRQQDAFTVPLVRVNDVLIPDTSLLNQPQPRQRPQSPPPHPSPHLRNPFIQLQQERQQHQQQQQQQQPNQPPPPLRYLGNPPNDMWRYPVNPGEASWRSGWRPRFLHPRYMAPNPFNDDNDDPLIGSTLENINFIRDSFIITDAPMSPNHRIQAWDFSKLSIPDISNVEKNLIVAECKIHNDASVDVSSDGRLLVTLLPTGRLSSTAMLGVYSLEWESLGQCLYTTSFEQNAVSVSLSPASRHLLVGLASRRVALLPSDRHTMAQIFRLEGGVPGRTVGARGRLCHLRDIEQDRDQGYMSLNCIRWAPGPGQGLVYGTNTGKLRILR